MIATPTPSSAASPALTTGRNTARWYLRNAGRLIVKESKLALRPRAKSFRRPVMMLFAPRSGSTWVMEMLARVQTMTVWEDPLIERNALFYARLYGFRLRPIYYTDADLGEVRAYLDDVFRCSRAGGIDFNSSGMKVNDRTMIVESPNTPWSAAYFQREYDAHLMHLVRHPLATVRSQIRFGRIKNWAAASAAHPEVRARLSPRALAALEAAVASGDETRMRLAQIFTGYLPLIEGWPDQGTVVTYEQLLRDDFTGFDFLAEYDPDWRRKAQTDKDKPSRSTTATTGGEARQGKAMTFSDAERAHFEALAEAFGAEAFLRRHGYLEAG